MNKLTVKYKDKILLTLEDTPETITLHLHRDSSTQGVNEVKTINAMLRAQGLHPYVKAVVITAPQSTGFKFDFDFYKTRSFMAFNTTTDVLVIDKKKFQDYKNKC
jgi:hypothetical protein